MSTAAAVPRRPSPLLAGAPLATAFTLSICSTALAAHAKTTVPLAASYAQKDFERGSTGSLLAMSAHHVAGHLAETLGYEDGSEASPNAQSQDEVVNWMRSRLDKLSNQTTAGQACPSHGDLRSLGCAVRHRDGGLLCECGALEFCYQPPAPIALQDAEEMKSFIAGRCATSPWVWSLVSALVGLEIGCCLFMAWFRMRTPEHHAAARGILKRQARDAENEGDGEGEAAGVT